MLLDDIKSLPDSPGVYEYFDKNAKLLYVGKAKNLKNRVRSYFSFTPTLRANKRLCARIAKMVNEASALKFVVTNSESDALILENSFIKSLKPKYNILLRDDKTYPYIYIDFDEFYPRPKITRKIIKKNNIKYFGPFSNGAKEILEAVYNLFFLVQKNGCDKEKKACLYYQIKRCLAPCENKISKDEYEKIVLEATSALKNPKIMLKNLNELMIKFSNLQNYEEAIKFRDTINIINSNLHSEIDIAKLEDFEVIAVRIESNLIAYTHFSIRDGKVINSISKINDCKFKQESEDLSEIYKQVILDFFDPAKPAICQKIYVYQHFEDQEILSNHLKKIHNKKFEISSPSKGVKFQLCKIAYENAKIFIQKNLKSHDFEFLNEFKEFFGLENMPINIESFDNSQLFGQASVGAWISYNIDGFNKENYRHLHLRDKNDYDQMSELLNRRILKFDELIPPDLWIIDGGKTLLDLALNLIKSSGVNVDVLAISKEKFNGRTIRSKGGASDIIYSKNGEFRLNQDDKKLQFIQRLRDEAHRFVIKFHRLIKKNEDLNASKLQNLGISKAMIIKLINYFGNYENIYKADFKILEKISNKSVATKITSSLQNNQE